MLATRPHVGAAAPFLIHEFIIKKVQGICDAVVNTPQYQ
jgi:hypothetical protein